MLASHGTRSSAAQEVGPRIADGDHDAHIFHSSSAALSASELPGIEDGAHPGIFRSDQTAVEVYTSELSRTSSTQEIAEILASLSIKRVQDSQRELESLDAMEESVMEE